MLVLPLILVVGAALPSACGGHLAGLREVRLRGEPFLLALLIPQAILPFLRLQGAPASVAYWLWVFTFPALFGLCLFNASHRSMLVVAAGVTLNGLVIVLNGGMPVSLQAASLIFAGSPTLIRAGDFAHVVMSSTTHLPWLGDVLPIAGPSILRGVASPGDILLACGASSTLAACAMPPARPEARKTLGGDGLDPGRSWDSVARSKVCSIL